MKFYKSKETLERILDIIRAKEKGAYFRFGDGDINLANAENDLYQTSNSELCSEMREALAINHVNALKTLPLYCKKYGGLENYMFPGNHECPEDWCDNIIKEAETFWGGEFKDVYSHVALSYLATYEPDAAINFLCALRNGFDHKTFVGNVNIAQSLLDQLFGNISKVSTPPRNAYEKINDIHLSVKSRMSRDYTLIITALGCSGRTLQKRLWNEYDNIFLFDFGSLMDALCGWNSRAWIELTKFDHKKFLNKLQLKSCQ